MTAVYFVTDDVNRSIWRFTELGFVAKGNCRFLGKPAYKLSTGRNNLVLLDSRQPGKMTEDFIRKRYLGICGFSIGVSSLKKLKEQLPQNADSIIIVTESGGRLYVVLKEYNLFFEFRDPILSQSGS